MDKVIPQKSSLLNQWVCYHYLQKHHQKAHSSILMMHESYILEGILGAPCTACRQLHQRVSPSPANVYYLNNLEEKKEEDYDSGNFLSLLSLLAQEVPHCPPRVFQFGENNPQSSQIITIWKHKLLPLSHHLYLLLGQWSYPTLF